MSIATDTMEEEQLRCGWHLAGKDGFCCVFYILDVPEIEYFPFSCNLYQVAKSLDFFPP